MEASRVHALYVYQKNETAGSKGCMKLLGSHIVKGRKQVGLPSLSVSVLVMLANLAAQHRQLREKQVKASGRSTGGGLVGSREEKGQSDLLLGVSCHRLLLALSSKHFLAGDP